MKEYKLHKVLSLPQTLEPDSIYYVKVGDKFKQVITDSSGNAVEAVYIMQGDLPTDFATSIVLTGTTLTLKDSEGNTLNDVSFGILNIEGLQTRLTELEGAVGEAETSQNNKVKVMKIDPSELPSEDEEGLATYFNSLPDNKKITIAPDEILIVELGEIISGPINPTFPEETGIYNQIHLIEIQLNLLDDSGNPVTNIQKLRMMGDGFYFYTIIKESQWGVGESSNPIYLHNNYTQPTLEYFFYDESGNAIWNFVELDVDDLIDGQVFDVTLDTNPETGVSTDIRAINPMMSTTPGVELKKIIIKDQNGNELKDVSWVTAVTTDEEWSDRVTYIERYEWTSATSTQWAYLKSDKEIEFSMDRINNSGDYVLLQPGDMQGEIIEVEFNLEDVD